MPEYYVSNRENFLHPVYEVDGLSARLLGSAAGTADWLRWERKGRSMPTHLVKLAATDAEAALIEGAAFYAAKR